MAKLRVRIARITVALGVAALCWACNAPFIPVPPPGQTATFSRALVTGDDGGQRMVWVAHGPALQTPGFSRAFVFDANRGAGVIAETATDGSYTSPPFDGTEGDRVLISYETSAGVVSRDVCFQLTETAVPVGDSGVVSAPPCPVP